MSNLIFSHTYLLFDTNVIQFLGKKNTQRTNLLEQYIEAISENFEKSISTITIYEAIQRCTIIKEAEVIKTISVYKQLEITKDILIISAYLADIYRTEKIPDSQISDADKIIAATSILTESPIITANPNDFPRPFFNEKDKKLILYKTEKDRDALLVVYLLEPDIDAINHIFAQQRV